MDTIALRTPDGTLTDVPRADLDALRGAIDGTTLAPGDDGYDDARPVWNAMIARRPALFARPAHVDDARTLVRFARAHGVALTVRGGGHHIGGRALADDAIVVDGSTHRAVRVDPASRLVETEPGVTLGDLDRATCPHGLVVPSGIVSETGLAGLTLGGGFGWLSRRFGLTCDHLESVELVTGAGERHVVDDGSDPTLMRVIRGGGGGFGAIVTRFRYRARRFDPEVLAGPVFRPMAEAREAFDRYRDAASRGPDTLGLMLKLGTAPPAPFLPASLRGAPAAITVACHGGAERPDDDLRPLRGGPPPAADLVERRPFPAFQAMFDAGEPRGRRDYWKSEYVDGLDDGLRDVLLAATARRPSPHANVKVFRLGGAVARRDGPPSAAAHRDAAFIVIVASAWEDPADDAANVRWVREAFARVHARSGRGGYVNFLTEDATGEERAAARRGAEPGLVAAARRRLDPAGVLVA